ncbi:hypothetical protein SEA_SIXAMA_15 [Gordonia phage Sixama]|uniref:Uncharacterized protein n=1 Tax=Gordonia phage Sixama TaxID=2653271 RepID=A0A5Q2F536_9CAUD|nr:hypothetical protein PP302_gp015 [Gordonia phage Sixama]QGF20194.1 hypothetical protein SEA_SIXAMA_15 [Gordonia phage Sixama]
MADADLHYVQRAREALRAELVRAQELYAAREKAMKHAVASMGEIRTEVHALKNALAELEDKPKTHSTSPPPLKDPFTAGPFNSDTADSRRGSD